LDKHGAIGSAPYMSKRERERERERERKRRRREERRDTEGVVVHFTV
jgi:hypothetical protein